MKKILLSIAYFPPIEYIALFLQKNEIFIENNEHYQKQSYRNRMWILSANGIQSLTIPIQHHAKKMAIQEVEIDYTTAWQRLHWKAITAAYNNSPFFFYFQDFFYPFYHQKIKYLFDYNQQLLEVILSLLRIEKKLYFTSKYVKNDDNFLDYRNLIHPKKSKQPDYPFVPTKSYYQVFESKFGFTPSLSILDLLCNKGNEAHNTLLTS